MVIDDLFDITKYLGISPLGYAGLLIYGLSVRFEDSCWLRV